jgi:hypothetical protein
VEAGGLEMSGKVRRNQMMDGGRGVGFDLLWLYRSHNEVDDGKSLDGLVPPPHGVCKDSSNERGGVACTLKDGHLRSARREG